MSNIKECLEDVVPIILSIRTVVKITKENLVHFIAYASPFVQDAYQGGYLEHKFVEDGLMELEIRTNFTEESRKIVDYLNQWSEIIEFWADVYDTDDYYDDERIFLEGDTFYRTTAREENYYDEYQNSTESFEVFRSLCLRDSIKEENSTFVCSEKGLEFETFLVAITESHSLEEFKERINTGFGKPLEFEHDDFYIRIYVDAQLKDTEETLELKMYVDEEELFVDYNCDIKHFENKRVYPVNVPAVQPPLEMLMEHLSENQRMKVKWDFMKDGEPMVTLLDAGYAKIFYRTDTIEIQHEQEWISPCSLCVNRLVKEISGCNYCAFEKI